MVQRTLNSDIKAAIHYTNGWKIIDPTYPLAPPSVQRSICIDWRSDWPAHCQWPWWLILVIAILFVFLNGRVAFWVAIGIPVSFMGTLAVNVFAGRHHQYGQYVCPIMALGIIVDDAIVVGEDAMTHFTMGETHWLPLKAVPAACFAGNVVITHHHCRFLTAYACKRLCTILIAILSWLYALYLHQLSSAFSTTRPSESYLQDTKNPKPESFRARFDAKFNHFRDGKFKQLLSCLLNIDGPPWRAL